MSKRTVLAVAMMFAAAVSFAQQRPFEREREKNVWLSSGNPAGLRERITDNISYAELYGSIEQGDYRHSYEAPSLWKAGAEARTVTHLDKFSMAGGFSFEQMAGKDMCGSMFMTPGYYPLDVLEFTPGQKNKQAYAFDGAVSVDMGNGFSLGSGLDFEAANYSKRKDLRYTDYRMDIKFTAGLVWNAGSNVFGLNYIYIKNSECPDPEQIGTGESSYYAFLDKGQHYGKYEVWTGSGVHLDESGLKGLPMKEHFNGAGLQWARNMCMIEVEYLYGQGSAGEKQFIWYRFPSHNVNVRLAERLEYTDRTFLFKEGFSRRMQKNYETVMEKISTNGVTTTVEYGSNQILERNLFSFYLKMDVLRDRFDYGLFTEMSQKESLASQVYPHIEDQNVNVDMAGVYAAFRAGKFEMGPELRFMHGGIVENKRLSDSTLAPDEPFRLEEWYRLETEYDTATRVFAKAFVRYNIAGGIYAQADASLTKAFGIEYLDGDIRTTCTARLGWTF